MTHALIVDDSRLACKVLADMLEPLHISSVSVYSAEEALQHLQSHMPDIIFLDHTMKGMDGLQTLKVIKSNPKTATIPVLMYTAKQGEVYVGQARALGAVDVLPKGLEKDYLHDALKRLCLLPEDKFTPAENAAKEIAEPLSTHEEPRVTEATNINRSIQPSGDRAEQSASDPHSVWREIWQKNIEPYLNRQKVAQTEEVIQFGKQQTRYLNREMHKTMEHFEHALVLRLEAHDDFLESQRALIAERRRKWLVVGVTIVLLVQLLLIWQFHQVEVSNQKIIAEQQQMATWQERLDDKIAQLQIQVALPVKVATMPEQKVDSLQLQNQQRESLAKLYPVNGGIDRYRGVTVTGYRFMVNHRGEIGEPPADQFFLTGNCQGDVFVAATPAQLFKDNQGALWFVDKSSEEVQVNVSSQLTAKNECLPLADELKVLRRMQRNISMETGIDEQDTLQLVVN